MAQLIDLTMHIEENMAFNPDHPRAPVLWLNQRHDITQHYYNTLWDGETVPPLYDGLPKEAGLPSKGHGWQSEQVIIGTHMGTHIDAALHFDPESDQDIATVPLEQCWGSSLLLDMRDVCSDNYVITIEDLDEAEQRTGDKVREGDIVLINTGHMERYVSGPNPDHEKWAADFPGLAHDTAPWFIDRGVKCVGSDTICIDADLAVCCHINFLLRGRIGKKPIQIIENLYHLEEIPQPRFIFFGLPLPISGGSGSPIRAVAYIE
jgi:kynurenine formamidase